MHRAPAFGSYDPDYGPYTGHPGDPRTPHYDEDRHWTKTVDEVADEFITNPSFVFEWLGNREIFEDKSIEPLGEDQHGATLGQLLVTIMAGRDADALRAVYALRKRCVADNIRQIEERAMEILADQEDQYDEPDHYADDPHHWY